MAGPQKREAPLDENLLTPAAAAVYAGISVSWVYRLTNDGTLPTVFEVRAGRPSRMIPRVELDRWRESHPSDEQAASLARSMLDRAIAEGLVPAEPPASLLAKVAHYIKHGKAA